MSNGGGTLLRATLQCNPVVPLFGPTMCQPRFVSLTLEKCGTLNGTASSHSTPTCHLLPFEFTILRPRTGRVAFPSTDREFFRVAKSSKKIPESVKHLNRDFKIFKFSIQQNINVMNVQRERFSVKFLRAHLFRKKKKQCRHEECTMLKNCARISLSVSRNPDGLIHAYLQE